MNHLIRYVHIRQQTSDTAQYHRNNVGVDVFESVDINPNNGREKKEDTSVLIAGAKADKQCSEAQRCQVGAADTTHCKVKCPSTQHVVQRENLALDTVKPYLTSNVNAKKHVCEKLGMAAVAWLERE